MRWTADVSGLAPCGAVCRCGGTYLECQGASLVVHDLLAGVMLMAILGDGAMCGDTVTAHFISRSLMLEETLMTVPPRRLQKIATHILN